MEIEKIKDYAREKGFYRVYYLGKFKGQDVYKPLMKDENASIGKPFFILVNGEEMKLVTGQLGLEIIDEIFNKQTSFRYTIR